MRRRERRRRRTMRNFIFSILIVVFFCEHRRDAFQLTRFSRNQFSMNVIRARQLAMNKNEPDSKTSLVPVDLNEELKTSFMSYAMSTILSRALPDVRDGLKPVHRRVLYSMQTLNLTPGSSYRKCARIVGEVLGKFHPHGDQSVYDALVRMAQDFVMLHPLVAGHGNFGSVDNDPPAAMRYTEAKLSSLAYDSLLEDVKEDTVDLVPNFDNNEVEPVVLPARIPILLLNGASGIAVGMATNIPPHNLGEIIDAVIALVRNPELSDDELFSIIPAPDFPTGGSVVGSSGARKLYMTGHGSIIIRAKCHNEVISLSSTRGSNTGRTRNAIVITELPYMTNKAALLEKIADLVNDKKLEGISDLRDESDREGIRMVIELKRDAIPAVVQNNLFKKTSLQTTFSGNMLALMENGTQPKRISLREMIGAFISFRFSTIRRRTFHKLSKLKTREHIVEGMIMALNRIEEIIELVKKAKDSNLAKDALMAETYGFTTEQADAILGLTLRRMTALEDNKLKQELSELKKDIKKLDKIMKEDKEVYSVLVAESEEIKKKHSQPRRTEVLVEEAELSEQDLLANDRSVILITGSGYIKRIGIEEFEAQSRGGKGKMGAKLSTEHDSVSQFFSCNDHDSVLFITDRGIAYSLKAFQIPLCSRTAKGVPLPQVLTLRGDETVTSVFPVDKFGVDEFLVLLTTSGFVKKTPLKAFASISARGLTIISLSKSDSLRWVRRCSPGQEILIATKDGYASRFAASDITSTGRTSRGVKALSLRIGDKMADMDILASSVQTSQSVLLEEVSSEGDNDNIDEDEIEVEDQSESENDDHEAVDDLEEGEEASGPPSEVGSSFVLVVTEKGYGKRISIDEFKTQRRAGKGVIITKFKQKAGGGRASRDQGKDKRDSDALACMRVCDENDEVVLSTSKGTIIRQKVKDITIQSRAATGVLIQSIQKDDSIIMVDIVPPSAIAEEDGIVPTPDSSVVLSTPAPVV